MSLILCCTTLFSAKFPSVKAANVVIDANTGRSKGYDFVRFGDDKERTKAMTEMHGVKCSSRAMRIGPATPRKTIGYQQQGGYMPNGGLTRPDVDSSNTTIFVGGLDSSVTDKDLRQPFSEYGEIVSVKIPLGRGCGFVQFVNRPDAEEALEKLNGTAIGKQTVRLSWGRSPANKQPRDKYGNQWVGPYYGGFTMGMVDTWYRNRMTRECMPLHLTEDIQCTVVISNKLAEEKNLRNLQSKQKLTFKFR